MLRWLMYQPNIQMLLGNHEAALLSCAFLFDEVTEDSIAAVSSETMALLTEWQMNGGDITIKALGELNKTAPDTVLDILDFLRDLPLYAGNSCLCTQGSAASARKDPLPITRRMNSSGTARTSTSAILKISIPSSGTRRLPFSAKSMKVKSFSPTLGRVSTPASATITSPSSSGSTTSKSSNCKENMIKLSHGLPRGIFHQVRMCRHPFKRSLNFILRSKISSRSDFIYQRQISLQRPALPVGLFYAILSFTIKSLYTL